MRGTGGGCHRRRKNLSRILLQYHKFDEFWRRSPTKGSAQRCCLVRHQSTSLEGGLVLGSRLQGYIQLWEKVSNVVKLAARKRISKTVLRSRDPYNLQDDIAKG